MGAMRRAAAIMAVVAIAAACGPAGPDAAARAGGEARAAKVLDNWAAAVSAAGGKAAVVPVGDLTGQVGDWEQMPFADNAKRALMAGLVQTEAELSAPAPPSATVTFSDGSTATVGVLGAQEAIVAIARSGEAAACDGCTPLIAESATLVTAPITTTRGPASGPVWRFVIRGTSVLVTRIAITNAITAPPLDYAPGAAVAIDAASGSASGTSVTVSFVGAPDPGSRPCGEDYTADAVESDLAVTVLVWRHPHVSLTPEACTAVGAVRTASATLAKPLGDRTVLDPATGQPVALTLAP